MISRLYRFIFDHSYWNNRSFLLIKTPVNISHFELTLMILKNHLHFLWISFWYFENLHNSFIASSDLTRILIILPDINVRYHRRSFDRSWNDFMKHFWKSNIANVALEWPTWKHNLEIWFLTWNIDINLETLRLAWNVDMKTSFWVGCQG